MCACYYKFLAHENWHYRLSLNVLNVCSVLIKLSTLLYQHIIVYDITTHNRNHHNVYSDVYLEELLSRAHSNCLQDSHSWHHVLWHYTHSLPWNQSVWHWQWWCSEVHHMGSGEHWWWCWWGRNQQCLHHSVPSSQWHSQFHWHLQRALHRRG